MTDDINAWIESTLLTQEAPVFERLGDKHTILEKVHHAPIASVFIDPPSSGYVTWEPVDELTLTESFFTRLKSVVSHHKCWWFFITMPQDEYTNLNWVAPFDDRYWNSWRLLAFEHVGNEGGGQFLGLIIGEQPGLIVFKLRYGLEIAYYGPNDLWEEIAAALYGDTGTRARGNTIPPCDASSNPV